MIEALFEKILVSVESLSPFVMYVILAIAVFVESLPVIGLIVPGGLLVILSGFLIKLDLVKWPVVACIVIVCALMGDTVGYLLGRKYGHFLIHKYKKYFCVSPQALFSTKAVISNHVGKAIIAGRFYSISRPFIPFSAGFSKVSALRFGFYGSISAVVWMVIHVGGGYFLGEVFYRAFGYFSFVVLVICVLCIYLYKRTVSFCNKNKKVCKLKN